MRSIVGFSVVEDVMLDYVDGGFNCGLICALH